MAEEKTEKGEKNHEVSKDEMKFLIKTLWGCLQAPAWTKDSLITLGKQIFAKKTLKEMDDKAWEEIWPHLKVMAETLDATLTGEATRRIAEEGKKEKEEKGKKEEEAGEAEAR